MTRLSFDTMTRVIPDTKRLLLAALLACTACTRPPAPPVVFPSAAEGAAIWVDTIATGLQLNPATDPATRADPYPCARATYAAQQARTPLPRCYYVPTGAARVVYWP